MSVGLTRRQHELLGFIQSRIWEFGYPPSFDEMVVALGLHSKSGVLRLLRGLEERGAIRRLEKRARAIEIIDQTKKAGDDRAEQFRRIASAYGLATPAALKTIPFVGLKPHDVQPAPRARETGVSLGGGRDERLSRAVEGSPSELRP